MIIASGFKTQHETGESKGTFNPSLRDTVEQNMFGAPNTRPVYGYIAHGDSEDGQPGPSTSAWVAPYGSIVIELKPSVHERTTVTCGDSLDKGMSAKIAPVRMGDIPKSSHDRGRKEMQRLSLAMDRSSLVRTTDGYFEAQIHGQLTANDIKRVIVKPLDYDAVKEMLKDHPDIEVVRSPDDGAHYSFAVVEGRWVSSS
jgi:hypothetical protein